MLLGAAIVAVLYARDGRQVVVADAVPVFLLIAALEGWGLYAWGQFQRDVRFERLLEAHRVTSQELERARIQVDSADAAVLEALPEEPAVRFNREEVRL